MSLHKDTMKLFPPAYQNIIAEQMLTEQRQQKWDKRFLEMAELVASWSKDPSTKCGAVIVRDDLTVASVGFNGFPKGCDDGEEVYADRDQKYGRVVHAELNAILFAREDLKDYTIYANTAPCDRCTAHIIQAGIKRIVHQQPSADVLSRWADSFQRATRMCAEAGVVVTPYAVA